MSLKNKIFLSLLIVFSWSCKEVARTKVTPDERKMADSLYAIKYPIIKNQVDSTCTAIHDSLFIELVDSISEVRLVNIQKLIDEK